MEFIVFNDREERVKNLETHKQERRAYAGNLDHLELATKDDHIKKYYRLLYKDNSDVWREYIVTDIEEVHDIDGTSFYIYAENSLIETKWAFIEDKRSYDQYPQNAINIALSDTRWTGITTVTENRNVNFYRISAFEAIESIMETWDLEILTEINVSKTKILSRKLYFQPRVGRSLDKRFSWTKDMTEISRRVNDDEIITALYGFGKSLPTEGGGFGRKIDFSEINNGLMYVANEEAKNVYGYMGKNGLSHRFGQVNINTDDKEELLRLTQEKLEEVSQPKITYKASVVDLASYGYKFEDVEVGDFVGVRDKELNIAIKARITELVEDLDGIEPKKLVIGNFVNTVASDITSLKSNINNLSQTTEEQINHVSNYVRISADGQNHIFSGTDEPTAYKVNDIWFKLLPTGVEVIYRWNGSAWVEIVDPQKMDTAVQAIQDIDQKAQEAFAKAEEAINRIEIKLLNDETGKVVGITMINDDGSESILFQIGDDGKVQITEDYFYIAQRLITNEMLASGISADKITSGTLDAAMATIINLNASNMTTGRLTGAKFFLDLDTGEMNLGDLLIVDASGAATLSEQAKSELKGDTGEQGPRGLRGQQGPEGKQGIQGPKGADGKDAIVVSATAPTDTTRIWRKSPEDNKLYIYVSGAWTRVDQEALTAISDKADISLLQDIREEMEKQNSQSSKLIGENEVTIGEILERLSQLQNGDGTGTLDIIQQDMQGLIEREVVWNQDKIDEIIASLQNQYPELFKLTQRVSMDDTGTTFYATDSEGGVMSTATKIKNDGMYIETDGVEVARFTREGTRTRNLQVDGNAYFGNHMVFKSGDEYTIFSHVGNLGQM